jgi:hypothetical protein
LDEVGREGGGRQVGGGGGDGENEWGEKAVTKNNVSREKKALQHYKLQRSPMKQPPLMYVVGDVFSSFSENYLVARAGEAFP